MVMSPLAISTLALLRERPMHPYELYSLMLNRRQDQLVKLSHGSLYHAVERLERDGLVQATGTEREGNRPERTTYAITDEGTEALQLRLTELLRNPAQEYPVFPMAIAEAHNLDRELVVSLLSSYAAQLDGRIVEYDASLAFAADQKVAEAYMINVDYLRAITRAQRDWVATLITRITTEDLTWPTP